jgi:hypothetical protein
MIKILLEIIKTLKADFGNGCKYSFVDKFCYRWYHNFLKDKG